MALRLGKGLAYLAAGAVLVWAAGLPVWASYLVGCWCGANAMGYLVSWAMATLAVRQQAQRDAAVAQATVVDFLTRKAQQHGTTTH